MAPIIQISELDRSDWIVVPVEVGKKFKSISGCSFEINPARLSYSPAVEEVGKELGLTFANTSEDSLGRKFIGGNSRAGNWFEFGMLAQFLGTHMTNMKEELDYLHLLYLGSQNKVKVYDVSGRQVNSKLCEKFLIDSIAEQSPSRREHVDATYEVGENGLEVHSRHIFNKDRKIIGYTSEVLDEDTLMEDKQIDAINYITKNHTSQGYFSKKVKPGSFCFCYPRKGVLFLSVTMLGVSGRNRVFLHCNEGPFFRDPSLGIRVAKEHVE